MDRILAMEVKITRKSRRAGLGLLALVALTLAALPSSECGINVVDLTVFGGLIGAGGGAAIGATMGCAAAKAMVGGVAGAVTGAATTGNSLNFGKPIWR